MSKRDYEDRDWRAYEWLCEQQDAEVGELLLRQQQRERWARERAAQRGYDPVTVEEERGPMTRILGGFWPEPEARIVPDASYEEKA